MAESELKFLGTRKAGKEKPFMDSIYAYYIKENVISDSIADFNEKLKSLQTEYGNKFIYGIELSDIAEVKKPSFMILDQGKTEIGVGTLFAVKITYSEMLETNYNINSFLNELIKALKTI